MMQRLPRWVEWGGFLLAMNAGFVNAVGVLGFRHQAVSHLTGVSTYFSIELVNQDAWQMLHLLWVILFFCAGRYPERGSDRQRSVENGASLSCGFMDRGRFSRGGGLAT